MICKFLIQLIQFLVDCPTIMDSCGLLVNMHAFYYDDMSFNSPEVNLQKY